MINIAVDGFTGSGKSTLVKILAQKLGNDFKVLDTGAIFRAFAVGFKKLGYENLDDENVDRFLKQVKLSIDFVGDTQKMLVNGEDVTSLLRSEEIAQLSSKISVFPQVRAQYLAYAQDFAQNNNCIIEGRDIGTVVMPNADVKIFLTADDKVRAKRRYEELIGRGVEADYEQVLADLRQRDKRDTTRDVAPLKPSKDSVVVDNSFIDLNQTAQQCFEIIQKKLVQKKCTNITIDGYVCSGKSTIAKALAKRLGFDVFDTGAIYRGIACAFDYMNLDETQISEEYIENFSKQINLSIEFIGEKQHVFVNGIDYTLKLRTERISALSAKISPFTCIREKVLKLQRGYAKTHNLVMEGRDIGSHVLPNADYKFFCTADEKVRAKRRFEQQRAMGNEVDFETVLKELQERDYKDVNRDHGALKILPESIVIDTTNMSLEESVEYCLNAMKVGKWTVL